MTECQKIILSLIRNSVLPGHEALPEDCDWSAVYRLGKKQQATALLYYGAVNSGYTGNAEGFLNLRQDAMCCAAVEQNQLCQAERILDCFDRENVDYLPLKGITLKKLYPATELRTMSDIDILIRTEQYDRIRPLMVQMGFTEGTQSDHEYIWERAGGVYVELHKCLMPSYDKDFAAHYRDPWQRAKPVAGHPNRYAMSPEDTFVFLLVHLAKHYRNGGIGLLHMTDIFVYLRANPHMDEETIACQLRQLGLLQFYENVRHTLDVWFDGAAADQMAECITRCVLHGGSYGTGADRVRASVLRGAERSGSTKQAKYKMTLAALFPPYRVMKEKYPVLRPLPILLPGVWVYRWVTALLFRRDNIRVLRRKISGVSLSDVESYRQSLEYVGLRQRGK